MKNNPINMGLGRLAESSLVFVRKFRWLLKADNLDSEWIKNLRIDYRQKYIFFEAYEVFIDQRVPILEYLDNPSDSLSLTTYDGCGNPLYTLHFQGIEITGQTCNFDYSSSDIATQKISIMYKSMTKEYHEVTPEDVTDSVPIPATDYDIEETEINHLNATAWIPGKAKPSIAKLKLTEEEIHLEKLLQNAYYPPADSE